MHPRPTRASRALLTALLVVSLLFVLGGVAMTATGADGGLEAVAFFGACAAVFVWRLRPDLFETETRSVEDLLAHYPGPVVLRASPRKNLFLAAASAVFGGAILWMLWREAIPAAARVLVWPGAALFLGGAPLLALVALRGASLRLNADGMVVTQIRRARRTSWRDAGGFTVATVAAATRMVVFDDAAAGDTRVAALNRRLAGRTSGLPDSYGLAPEGLAALLTAWSARARRDGRGTGGDPVGTWRALIVGAGKAWVLFAHGTCVVLPEPEPDPAAQAARLLREWGPVHPGSPAGDFSVIEPEGVPGFVVTGHHPDILTYVGPDEAGSDAAQVAVGLLGRDKRDRDARDLRVVHVEARGRAGGAATGNKLNHER